MKTLELNVELRSENAVRIRRACRGILVRDGSILLSYAQVGDLYMIPGGGKEGEESDSECCAREVSEETGLIIRPTECVLEIVEYHEKMQHINRYFTAEVLGRAERKPTDLEQRLNMGPRWVPIEEALSIFGTYTETADVRDMRRWLYMREYTALHELFGNKD
jgi:8-oxo-dGTP pyrophosphatase MutT (NUDIX family)